jgi:hypothetical protein
VSSYHKADFKLLIVASIPNDVAPPIVLDEFQASFHSCLKNLLAAKYDTVEYVYYREVARLYYNTLRGVDGPSVWSILCQLVHLNVVLLHAKKRVASDSDSSGQAALLYA